MDTKSEKEKKKEERRITGIVMSVNIGYWQSLIAIHGVLISVFAILFALKNINLFLFLLVILPSVVSCLLIVKNFQLAKEQYGVIISRTLNNTSKENDVPDALDRRKEIERNNKIVLNFFIFQIVIIIIFAFYNFFSEQVSQRREKAIYLLESKCSNSNINIIYEKN